MGAVPEKIRLVPDEWHVHNVGRLEDGRLYLVDQQLDYDREAGFTRDFICTFVFDSDGALISHQITNLGGRGQYPGGTVKQVYEQHLSALGSRDVSDIWIKPFSVEAEGRNFGFILRDANEDEDGEEPEWRVEFMPGNTLSFYAPWDEGGYDT